MGNFQRSPQLQIFTRKQCNNRQLFIPDSSRLFPARKCLEIPSRIHGFAFRVHGVPTMIKSKKAFALIVFLRSLAAKVLWVGSVDFCALSETPRWIFRTPGRLCFSRPHGCTLMWYWINLHASIFGAGWLFIYLIAVSQKNYKGLDVFGGSRSLGRPK